MALKGGEGKDPPRLPSAGYRPLDALSLTLSLLVLGLIFRRLLVGRVLAAGDLQFYFHPYWTAAAHAFREGELPLWNPYLFAGAPLLANSQAGVFYPLNWPLWALFPSSLEGTMRSLHLSVLLHLGIAATNAWVLARCLGGGRWGAALASLLYAGGGFLGLHVEHLNQLQGLAWLPLLFLPGRRGWPSPASVVTLALILLAGHTQTAFIATVGLVVYHPVRLSLLHVTRAPREKLPAVLVSVVVRAVRFLLPFSLAGLVALVQLAPTLELSALSTRGAGLPWREAVSFSVAPWELPEALLPPYLTPLLLPEGVAYVGVVGLALAGWGTWIAGRRRQPRALAALLLGGVGLFMALGAYNPAYLGAVRLGLPGFVQFRAPARYLALYALATSLLAGLGFERLGRRGGGVASLAVALFVAAELTFAAERLPHADATVARAYTDLRPATAHLVAAARAEEEGAGRFLSISKTLFQPGDEAEIEMAYAQTMSPDALWNYFVTVKAREVLAPNLPLAFRVPAADGYDGGLLPLRHYVTFSRLLLERPQGTLDGRLRENLTRVPDPRWLSLLNVRFLITDKVGDAWFDDVFYDRQFQPRLAPGETLRLGWLPGDFRANGLGVLYQGEGRVQVALDDGRLLSFELAPHEGETPQHLSWAPTATPITVTLRGEGEGLIPGGISLVDDRTGAFYPLVVAEGFRLAHSGDVKIYEHLGDLPRAFVVGEARFAPDDETALALMTDPGFDPFRQVVLSGEGTPAEAGTSSPSDEVGVPGSAEVLEYDSTRVEVVAEMTEGGYLVLADAWYPGWRIEVVPLDGGVAREMRPLRADLLFRAVHLTPGDWRVTFTYRPRALYVGSIASALGVVLLTAYAIIVLRGARRARGSPAVS